MPTSRRDYWIILSTALLAVSFGVVFVARHVVAPSDGARLKPGGNALTPEGLILTPLVPRPGGLVAGDLVVAVAGRGLETWAQSLLGGEIHPRWGFGETLEYTVLRQGNVLTIPVTLGRYPLAAVIRSNWGTIAFALFYLVVAGFVFIRRPDHPAGRILFLSAAALTSSTAWSFGLQASDFMDGAGFWLFKICTLLFYNLYWTASLHFALLFPRPLPVMARRWFLPVMYGLPFVLLLFYLAVARVFSSGLLDWFTRWTAAEGAHAALFLSATLAVLFFQYRRNRSGVTRRQMRWVALGGLMTGGSGLLLYILPGALGLGAVSPNLVGLIVLPFPLAVAVAILRHNLFDIDTLINRALVYGALTGSTMALYILIVGYLGTALQAQERTLLAFLATGLVAVLFQPLRDWLQRRVNHWMYGDRDDPYLVLTRLGRRLDAVIAPEAVLNTIVETIAQTLKLPYAAIAIQYDDELVNTVTYGLPSEFGEEKRYPLVYQNAVIAELIISPRAEDEPFTPAEERLLDDLARQVEVAVYNLHLAADLQRSRQKLVTTREEERRRIRRDLHDGLGTQLASQTLTLEAIDKLLEKEPEAARVLIQDLRGQTKEAIADIRRLIYDLRPPALDGLGLAGAIREGLTQFRGSGVNFQVKSPDALPPLPAAVETAAFRIVQEAVHNTIRHAQANYCNVLLKIKNHHLQVLVEDDGAGISPRVRAGVGLHSMRERAEELGGRLEVGTASGGGTRVRAWLPLG